MELYYIIAITDHDRGEAMGSLYHAAGLHLILSMPARGTATSEHLAIYGLDATEKCVIAAVGSAQEADSLIRSAKRKLFIDIPGNGVMLTVPLKSVAGGKTLSYLTDDLKAGGAPNMNFEHELITVILNEGYSDFVMDAARAAENQVAGANTGGPRRGRGRRNGAARQGHGRHARRKILQRQPCRRKGYDLHHRPQGRKGRHHALDQRASRSRHQSGRDLLLAADLVRRRPSRKRGKLSVPVIQQSAAAHAAALPFLIFNLPSFPRGRGSRCRPHRLRPCSGDTRRS